MASRIGGEHAGEVARGGIAKQALPVVA